MARKFNNFDEFYQFYLQEHSNRYCRRMHFIGSSLVLLALLICVVTQLWALLILIPVIGYGFAWLGHFIYEGNKPATFTYPFYSLLADWVMFKDIITRKISI
ncbi:DUF962 domain-containing protein [Pseudoalteromonas luteoviolacea]|uniref:Transmembrane protein n=1 Tax=Pseudoalteromonas luteoviolacea DSM 6061 TaxID=1365250 RepID=A0A167A9X9_9GAMM|nr:DUF962 domain-containing protein [Pseudoalteromonas luteoviolacea]KZN45140.1 hypothetical protein N475_07750 [Pseudoalteromonas luteoviolacea DSM 6061]KZN60550.1 hypothetical protein N474_05755 [Pseudoalteromonas luteoviolacea CPMOR-2]MBE0386708.1 hypothetical protein [Pseudoalteromonas luteoviolacea DSM 6061]TQF71550.1 DUF962 domain-containing protein [Pseudoalteromonas luteoviolacea]